MNSKSIQVALSLTVLLSVFLFMLSCSTAPQNSNQNQNQNRAGNEAAADKVADSNDPCKQTTPGGKKQKLHEKVLDKIENDPALKAQYHGYGYYPPPHQNDPPTFTFEVTEGQYGSVAIKFKGDISGPGQLEALIDFLDDYQKKGCLEKVSLVPGPVTATTTPGDGFEWVYCEFPKVACPNGECQETCSGKDNTNSPTNGNTNTNTNSNTSSNSNSNKP